MTNLNLGITPPALARPSRLRADLIRRDTLTMLAAALREDDDNSLQNAIDALVDALSGDPSDNEVDQLVADIEDSAGMGRADMPLTPGDVQQLAEEAAHAAAVAGGSVVHLPQQKRRAS